MMVNRLGKIFFLLLTPFVLHAQLESPNDFLNRYAVLVEAVSIDSFPQVFQGSGFLVMHQGTRYLITNHHNISERDYYSGQENPWYPFSDLRIISLYPKNTVVEIPLEDTYRTGRWRNIQTDLIAFPLPDSYLTSVPVVNIDAYNFLQPLSRLGVEVFSVGFPRSRTSLSSVVRTSRTSSTSRQTINFSHNNFGELPVIQTNISGAKGMSGGPVFIWPNRNEEPIFVGVHSSSQEGFGYFWPTNFVKDLFENN